MSTEDEATLAAESRESATQLLAELAADGSDLTRAMDFEYFVIAPSEAIARVVAVRTAAMGFEPEAAPDEDAGTWICRCRVSLVPEVERIVALDRLLDRLAAELGAFVDGFGSSGNASH
jgi:regulator of RNase E activity RraB